MVHVPFALSEALLPETAQMDLVRDAKLTVRLEVAVAERLRVDWMVCAEMGEKPMVCVLTVTAKL